MRKFLNLKRLIAAAAVGGLAMGYAATPAQASFVMRVDDFGTGAPLSYEFTTSDGAGPLYGPLVTGALTIGVFNLVSATGSNPGFPNFDVIDISNSIGALGAGHLTIELSGTDFIKAVSPNGGSYVMTWGGTADGAITVTATGCIDPGNALFTCGLTEGVLVAPPPNPYALSATGSTGVLTSPYAMYLRMDVVTTGAADQSSNLRLGETAVPEPNSMILLGTGLVGLARAARRRLSKNRA